MRRALRQTFVMLGIAALSACGGIATQTSREIATPRLPVTVEGVVFYAPQFSKWTSSEQRRVGYRNVQFIRPTRVVLKGNRVGALAEAPTLIDPTRFTYTLRDGDVEQANCCLSATLRDYGRLGLLALGDGVALNGKRLLPKGWMAESTSPAPTNPEYGYLWWLLSPPGRYAGIGIHGQQIYVDPSNNLVVVIQSFWDNATGTALSAHRKAFRDALTRDLIGHVSPPSR